MTFESLSITTRGQKFGLYRKGPATAPKILLVHGGPGMDSSYLFKLAHSLSDDFQTFLLDQRGEGRSPCGPESLNQSLEDYADDIAAVLREILLPEEKLHLIGHSFGGFVSIKTLSRHPQFFARAVLLNTAADLSWVEAVNRHGKAAKISEELCESLERKLMAGTGDSEDFKNLMVQYAPLYFCEIPLEQARQWLRQGQYNPATYRSACLNIYPRFDLIEDAKRISQPCLVVGASGDLVIPPSCQESLQKLIPHSQLSILPQVGHFPWVSGTAPLKSLIKDHFGTPES